MSAMTVEGSPGRTQISRAWTDEEIGVLAENIKMTAGQLAELLGRTPASINNARKKMRSGWTQNKPRWSRDEDDQLRLLSETMTVDQIIEYLPSRSRKSILSRRHRLGLTGGYIYHRFNPYFAGPRTVVARTCTKCGVIRLGAEFRARKDRSSTWCKFCETERAAHWRESNPALVKAANAGSIDAKSRWRDEVDRITTESATRNGYPYLESDFEVLSDESLTIFSKALRLRRSYAGVAHKCLESGFKSNVSAIDISVLGEWKINNPNIENLEGITAMLRQELAEAGIDFPKWDWDDEDES